MNLTGSAFGTDRPAEAGDGGSGVGWAAVALLLGVFAVVGWWAERPTSGHPGLIAVSSLDWQPGLAFSEPWRAWTAVAVHYSRLHLAANLAGAALTAAFGIVARVPARAAWAWFAAWPLTQFGLLVEPALLHFGGLSGVLHAGVVIVVVCLLSGGSRAQRLVGWAVLAGCATKLIGEAPWGPPLRQPAGWDIAVAPIAHATGVLAGAVCGLIVTRRRLRKRRKSPP